jgi:urease accessory protein
VDLAAVGAGVTVGTLLDKTRDVFAANRAVGRVALSVKAAGGRTRRARVHEHGSLRARFPNGDGAQLDAVLVNTAGGIAGGDRFDVDIKVEEGARLSVTTTAAEKIYRSLGPEAVVDVSLDVAAGATLHWLPQETILFDQVNLRRTIEVDLASDATLLLAEAVVFGRSAMGETVSEGRFFDRWRVRRAGGLIFAEAARLDGAIARQLAEPATAKDGVAIATVVLTPGDDAAVAAVRALGEDFAGEVGISAFNGMAVARLCARDGAALRHDLASVLSILSGGALPRLWLN